MIVKVKEGARDSEGYRHQLEFIISFKVWQRVQIMELQPPVTSTLVSPNILSALALNVCETSGSHGTGYEAYYLLQCDMSYVRRLVPSSVSIFKNFIYQNGRCQIPDDGNIYPQRMNFFKITNQISDPYITTGNFYICTYI
jgi:hypothetical protein